MDVAQFAQDLIMVLVAGTLAGIVCKRLGVSLLVGYLVVGAVIGGGGLHLVPHIEHELELVAEIGALLLLFAVGIEFSVPELARLARYFFVGGTVQMVLVAVPLGFTASLFGMSTTGAILAGLAGAFSSTVLVFRALTEAGQTETPLGRRAIGVLLFQDAALVPLLMIVPLLTGDTQSVTALDYASMVLRAGAFLLAVLGLHLFIARVAADWIAGLRSVELVALVTITLLSALCYVANLLALPPAIGAFAAGLVLSGHRMSKQIDAIVLPFRETFAAVFFVSLGMLLRPGEFLSQPLLLTAGIIGVITLKTLAAAVAMKLVGLSWQAALGTGLVLSQMGEFSFLLASRGVAAGLIPASDYSRMLFVAVCSLIITPLLLKYGLRLAAARSTTTPQQSMLRGTAPDSAVVIGVGLIGGRVASLLETAGVEVTLMDLSPVNLHPFAQAGFRTVAGNACETSVLDEAGAGAAMLAVVCMPDDNSTRDCLRALRRVNPHIQILARCRYKASRDILLRAGATVVISEEQEVLGPLLSHCRQLISGPDVAHESY
jgi:CPA2 family monovalent cation:H+ antiporter-2